MKIKAIVTGATGMVGEGVMHECLLHPDVEEVLIINRRPAGVSHPKLKEIVHHDFYNLSSIEDKLAGYDACFFCLGTTSLGLNEEQYSHITYDITLHFAQTLSRKNPNSVFCYVSGAGTSGNESAKNMWIRVKSKTENALLKLPFRKAYMFRPGLMIPTKGLKNTLKLYKPFMPFMGLFHKLFPKYVCTLAEVGRAMITCATKGYDKTAMEVKDIVKAANEASPNLRQEADRLS
jgi:uncharacterized protein YbjT (DUF2867 family)